MWLACARPVPQDHVIAEIWPAVVVAVVAVVAVAVAMLAVIGWRWQSQWQ